MPFTRVELQQDLQAFFRHQLIPELDSIVRQQNDSIVAKIAETVRIEFKNNSFPHEMQNGSSVENHDLPSREASAGSIVDMRSNKSRIRDSVVDMRQHKSRIRAGCSMGRAHEGRSEKGRSSTMGRIVELGVSCQDIDPDLDSRDIVLSQHGSYASGGTTYASLPLKGHPEPQPEHYSYHELIQRVVLSTRFEQASGMLVLLNAVSLGYDTDMMATRKIAEPTEVSCVLEAFFCIIFSIELTLRLISFRCAFFTMEGRNWNCFDLLLVMTQWIDDILNPFYHHQSIHNTDFSVLRLLRFFRFLRIARLLRAFRLFDELRVIIQSIQNSITSLGWSLFLLAILIYATSLIFLQSIVSAGETPHHEEIQYWFSSLFRTWLTMFECIVGGVSWDSVVTPISEDISPALAIFFCVYVSMCLFAMMNLLTGVFVDKAMTSVREDQDIVLANRIRDLFLKREWGAVNDEEYATVHGEITWEIFQEKLESDAMKDYFSQINVRLSEARALFELMDADGSGSLDSHEIVRACLQLRGPARALDLAIVTKDVNELQQQLEVGLAGIQSMIGRGARPRVSIDSAPSGRSTPRMASPRSTPRMASPRF